MSKERNNFKAGLFILISIALIVTVLVSIHGIERLITPEQERVVSFRLSDDIGGLNVGDEVRLGGYKIGVVKSIEFRPAGQATRAPTSAPTTSPARDDSPRLLVTFTFPTRYTIYENAVIGVQTPLTAPSVLNIIDIGSGTPSRREVALTGRAVGLTSILASLGEVAPELKPVLADVRTRVVPELTNTLVEYKGAGQNLREILGDTKGDIRDTIGNLKGVTATAKEKLPETMEAAKRLLTRLDETVKNTEGTLEDIKKSMANFKEVSGTARDIVSGNKGKIESMIASLKTAGDNLKAATAEIRHSPWRLLYKPGAGEMNNLNLYDTARQFADGASSLDEAALALRDALATKDAKPEQVKELLHQLDKSFANFKQVEDKLWTSVRE
jgi:ABC-type transporter Mla subunit MlaD